MILWYFPLLPTSSSLLHRKRTPKHSAVKPNPDFSTDRLQYSSTASRSVPQMNPSPLSSYVSWKMLFRKASTVTKIFRKFSEINPEILGSFSSRPLRAGRKFGLEGPGSAGSRNSSSSGISIRGAENSKTKAKHFLGVFFLFFSVWVGSGWFDSEGGKKGQGRFAFFCLAGNGFWFFVCWVWWSEVGMYILWLVSRGEYITL